MHVLEIGLKPKCIHLQLCIVTINNPWICSVADVLSCDQKVNYKYNINTVTWWNRENSTSINKKNFFYC